MAEPPLGHGVVDMIDALPSQAAALYAQPGRVFCSPDAIPPDFGALNRRYSQIQDAPKEWEKYLSRREVWDLWALRPAEEAAGLLAVA